MNKYILSAMFALVLVFGVGAVSASAATCGDGTGGTVVCGNGNPELVVNGFGVTNSQVPHVAPGASVSDAAGITDTCPIWYKMGCLDIFGTEVYKNQARFLAKQLQERGFALGKYVYWLNH